MHGLSSPEVEGSISVFAALCSCRDLAQKFCKKYEAHCQSRFFSCSESFMMLSPSKCRARTTCTLKNRTLWITCCHLLYIGRVTKTRMTRGRCEEDKTLPSSSSSSPP